MGETLTSALEFGLERDRTLLDGWLNRPHVRVPWQWARRRSAEASMADDRHQNDVRLRGKNTTGPGEYRTPLEMTLEFQRAASASHAMENRVTVVVATQNRRDSLLGSLERLRSLPERPRVLLIDNASTDGTPEAIRSRFPDIEISVLAQNLGAAARTIGVRRADTPFVAFADDDSWWEPGALTLAADVLERHPNVALVAARILLQPSGHDDPLCALMELSPLVDDKLLPGTPVLGFAACGSVIRRSAYLRTGGFHPRLHFGGEEQLLALDLARQGWRLVYLPTVVAHHEPSPLRDAGERSQRQARNGFWFVWLRRALPTAVTVTWGALRKSRHDAVLRAGLAEAVRGLPWIVRERDFVGPELERKLQLLDRQHAGGISGRSLNAARGAETPSVPLPVESPVRSYGRSLRG